VTISIALSNRFSVEAVDEIYAGIKLACERYGVDMVGGDTTTSVTGLVISVTAIGKAKADKLVYRSGAKPGDIICVSGDLGGAYAGLQLLEREKLIHQENPDIQPDLEGKAYIVGRQLKPEARRDIIEELAKANVVPTAMIDISDGLASEVLHICKSSGVGAIIEEALIPIHSETYEQVLAFNVDPTTAALSGGEDYELLFTIPKEDIDKIRFIPDINIIGDIVEASEGARMQSKSGKFHPIIAQGWSHF
jgi:thiamine-monophosphate kinase